MAIKHVVTSGVCPICGSDDFVWDQPNASYGVLMAPMITGNSGTFVFNYRCDRCHSIGSEKFTFNFDSVTILNEATNVTSLFKAGEELTFKKVKGK